MRKSDIGVASMAAALMGMGTTSFAEGLRAQKTRNQPKGLTIKRAKVKAARKQRNQK